MKSMKLKAVAGLAVVLWVGSYPVHADSSIMGKATNKATVKKAINASIGENTKATVGSMGFKDSHVEGNVSNTADVQESINAAIGKGATAHLGSVSLENSKVNKGGEITNKTQVKKVINASIGENTNMTVGGMVANDANVEEAINAAIGKGAVAHMGSVYSE
jgi:hypothetical protein